MLYIMSSKIMYAKNGRPYKKLPNGQVRFVKGKSKTTSKTTKKGNARKNKPKGSRLAYDDTMQEMKKMWKFSIQH